MRSVETAQALASSCEIGANSCEKPVVDFFRVADVLIRAVKALTDDE